MSSNITRLMEAKPSRELQQDNERQTSSTAATASTTTTTSSSRTVDELLKMLSGSSSSRSKKPPPPLPPKPSPMTMTLEAAKRTLGIDTDSKNSNNISSSTKRIIDSETMDRKDDQLDINKFNSSLKLDAKQQIHRHRNDDALYSSSTSHASPPSTQITYTNIGCVVYDSNATPPQPQPPYSRANKTYDTYDGANKQPIVTEYSEEANNNSHMQDRVSSNVSSVKILEVPFRQKQQQSSNEKFNNDNNSCHQQHRTFLKNTSASKQQNYLPDQQRHQSPITSIPIEPITNQNNGMADTRNSRIVKATCKLNEPVDIDAPIFELVKPQPRTSTPTNSIHLPSNSSSGASTATNNNLLSSQNIYLSHKSHDSSNSEQTDDDTLNISRDTDELTNTSGHNQSGCELVGINDNSDPNNCKGSPKSTVAEVSDGVPYTVQFFNDTTMGSPKTGQEQQQQLHISEQHTCVSVQDNPDQTNDLKNLVTKLQEEIDGMHGKIACLTDKVEDLESQLEAQRKDTRSQSRLSTDFCGTINQDRLSPGQTMKKHGFSKSTTTLNRTAPMSSSKSNTTYSPMNTYSRDQQVANISRSHYASPIHSSNGNLAPGYNSSRKIPSKSSNNSISRPLRKTTIQPHSSMSSLYVDAGGDSISPTNNGHLMYKQPISPGSTLNLSSKRDPYSSMLSLSSISQQGTLKRAISGSVSNLSQTNSQLSQWPSMSNFINTKHQAKDILYDDEERVIRMVLYNTLLTMRLPSWISNDYDLDRIIDPPNVRLKLDWVHGYRGRDCRTNIYYLPTGECIYFVASIVVLYNPEEKKQRHYLGHTDSVKCLAVHPNKLIVASGQSAILNRRDKRPIVRVWDTVNLNTLRVIGFNEDFDASICCLAFSKHDQGATLAVVDESNEHTITLLDWQREKNWRLAETNSGHEPVLAIDFHPIDKYSLVAVGKSTINFWDIRGMTLAKKAGLFDKYDRPKYVLCLTFNDLGDTITGDSNGNVIIWPRGSNRPGRIIHDVHIGGVFSVLAMKDGSYLTGGRDRRIIEWDEEFNQTGRQAELPEHCGGVRFITYARGSQVLIGTLRNSILLGTLDTNFTLIMQGHTEAISALAIHPLEAKYVTGGFDEQLHFMNSYNHRIERTKCLMMPATAASFSSDGQLIVIGSTLGKWLVLDYLTEEILFTSCDGSGTINCVKFSPDGNYFSMGSSDSQLYVYQVSEAGSKFTRIGTCVGHSAPIKEIDWSEDSRYFQSQSMNFELLFWKAENCRSIDDQDIVYDLKWKTHNCSLGFNVIGIWSDSIDSALINHCDKSNKNDLIASVTDTGFINIYKWPTCYNQCSSQKYNGNVEKFNFVKFLHDDSKLITVGAKSCVSAEWKIENL